MRASNLLLGVLSALGAASLSAQAQEWQLEQQTEQGPQGPWQSSAVGAGKPGISRTLRVAESSPGLFSVVERTPFPNIGGDPCIGRSRTGHLSIAEGRQVLTIEPAMQGCPETRFLVEAGGSGWEERREGGQWVRTGARLVGTQQVARSQAAPVAVPTATAESEPRRESPALAMNGHRRALVIGNDGYRSVGRLLNARADAQSMARSLQRAGFDVTTRLDVDGRAFRAALRDFKATIEGGDEVIVFYSGHGVQIAGTNYLLPVDIQGESEEQIRDDGIALQRVLDDVSDKRARFMLAVVDACRDNPFKGMGNGRALGGGRGLAPTTAATGQMIIYSAGSGQQALDRLGPGDRNPNGLFTRVFLKEMETRGVPVDRVLRNVRNEVVRMAHSVGHEQTPALYDQTVGDFYLRPAD